MPAIAAIGFGAQQFLQVIADPVTSTFISSLKSKSPESRPDSTALLPWGISDVDAKKAILGGISFVLGLLIASSITRVRVLKAANLDLPGGGWDLFITALTISAGNEGINSVVKLVQYIKDAVKTRTPPSVAQNSPVPQAPAQPLLQDGLFAESNNAAPAGIDASEKLLDVQARAKE